MIHPVKLTFRSWHGEPLGFLLCVGAREKIISVSFTPQGRYSSYFKQILPPVITRLTLNLSLALIKVKYVGG